MKKPKTLHPIRESQDDYDRLEASILSTLRKEIYLPLMQELGGTLENSREDLVTAILKGRLYFEMGAFRGAFDSSSSKELKKLGATWNRSRKSYDIGLGQLPMDVTNAISLSFARLKQAAERIDKKLEALNSAEIADHMRFEEVFDTTLWKLDRTIASTMKNIVIAPEMTSEQRKELAKEYTKSLKLDVVDFTRKETQRLREEVKDAAFGGVRYEQTMKMIQKSFGISQNKAKFVARQETGLLTAKFSKIRYQSAGLDEYFWGCVVGSAGSPVRPMHKKLEGKVFKFSEPPVVNEKGERKNPKEDYGCRCYARVRVKF